MNKWLLDVRDGQLMYNRQGAVPDTDLSAAINRLPDVTRWADVCNCSLGNCIWPTAILVFLKKIMNAWALGIAYQSLNSRQNAVFATVKWVYKDMISQIFLLNHLFRFSKAEADHLTFDESTPFIDKQLRMPLMLLT